MAETPDFDSLDRRTQERILALTEARTLEQLRNWIHNNEKSSAYEQRQLSRRFRLIIVTAVVFLGSIIVVAFYQMERTTAQHRDLIRELQHTFATVELETYRNQLKAVVGPVRVQLDQLQSELTTQREDFSQLQIGLESARLSIQEIRESVPQFEKQNTALENLKKNSNEGSKPENPKPNSSSQEEPEKRNRIPKGRLQQLSPAAKDYP